jgi:hypothetical protein
MRAVSIDDERIHVLVPWGSNIRTRGFAVIRRTSSRFTVVATERLRYVDAATAVVAATGRMHDRRAVLAALSDALQRRVVQYDDLVRAHVDGPPRNRRLRESALATLDAGTRSVPEAEFRTLVSASSVLPAVDYNVWLRLACGRVVCVDALITSSAVVHETNGRIAHAREDLFEDMQERHDAMTASGLTVLHNAPSRIRSQHHRVLAEVERCHLMYDGRGLPPGVSLLANGRAP